MNLVQEYVYYIRYILTFFALLSLGCSKNDLKMSYLRVCENRKNSWASGMRDAIQDPADLSKNVDCKRVSQIYHDECKDLITKLTGAAKYSGYINCMQRRAVIEGTKDLMESKRRQR